MQEIMKAKRWTCSKHFGNQYSSKKKVIHFIWWDFKGIVFSGPLNDLLKQKTPKLIKRKGECSIKFDNLPKASTAWIGYNATPTISSRCGIFDYYLFLSLVNFLDGKTVTSNSRKQTPIIIIIIHKLCYRIIKLSQAICIFVIHINVCVAFLYCLS